MAVAVVFVVAVTGNLRISSVKKPALSLGESRVLVLFLFS